jgi:hypothetical protein
MKFRSDLFAISTEPHPACAGCQMPMWEPAGIIAGKPYCDVCFWPQFRCRGPRYYTHRKIDRDNANLTWWEAGGYCPLCHCVKASKPLN